jgi:hypothetical protein
MQLGGAEAHRRDQAHMVMNARVSAPARATLKYANSRIDKN